MKIEKSMLQVLWYEDACGNKIDNPHDAVNPEGAAYMITRFPLQIRTVHSKLILRKDVDACEHPREFIKPTSGWIDGVVGRECTLCHGRQVKRKNARWKKTWDASGSREVMVGTTSIGDGSTILAMANSGDFTLKEAILAYSMACERCMNVLDHKYLGEGEGYPEQSAEWNRCGTICDFCRDMPLVSYKLLPKTKTEMLQEVVKILNDYDNGTLSVSNLERNILHYYCVFNDDKYFGVMDQSTGNFNVNKATCKFLGKRRSDVIAGIISRSFIGQDTLQSN